MRAVAKGLSLRIEGLEAVKAQLRDDGPLGQRVRKALVRGMTEITEDLLGRAMRDAPVDEGTLRGSGHATVYVDGKVVARSGFEGAAPTPGVARAGMAGAVVGEVGFDQPYARIQHERLDYRHPKGGKAKYLEDNLKDQATRYGDHLADSVRGAL